MSAAIFLLLAVAVAAALVYPLMPGQRHARQVPQVTDGEIVAAVQEVRRARAGSGHRCAACGQGHRPDDRFCVRCGAPLSQQPPSGLVCRECGAPVKREDAFCPKCGHHAPAGGEAL
jgi:uncharacterized OB-fold protein